MQRGCPHIDRCGKLVSNPGAVLLAGLSATGIRDVHAAWATLARFVNKNESVGTIDGGGAPREGGE